MDKEYIKKLAENPRFIQVDPVIPEAGSSQSLNRYSYVNNNPLKYVDPSGNTLVPLTSSGSYGGYGGGWSVPAISGGYYSGYGLSNSLASSISVPTVVSYSMPTYSVPSYSCSYTSPISGGAYHSSWSSQNLYMSNIVGNLSSAHLYSPSYYNPLPTLATYLGSSSWLTTPTSGYWGLGSISLDIGPLYKPFLFSTHNEINPWRHHDMQGTEAILRRGRNPLLWNPILHALPTQWGGYDYGAATHHTFTINEQDLDAKQFGNYIAGYLCTYHMGLTGYIGARAAGNAYGGGGFPWFFSGDDADSIRYIRLGAHHGASQRVKDIWKREPIWSLPP